MLNNNLMRNCISPCLLQSNSSSYKKLRKTHIMDTKLSFIHKFKENTIKKVKKRIVLPSVERTTDSFPQIKTPRIETQRLISNQKLLIVYLPDSRNNEKPSDPKLENFGTKNFEKKYNKTVFDKIKGKVIGNNVNKNKKRSFKDLGRVSKTPEKLYTCKAIQAEKYCFTGWENDSDMTDDFF